MAEVKTKPHRFKRPFVSESVEFFLPRGHNTVRRSGGMKGYLHGGASPEEAVVPTAKYKLVKAAWKKPAARFLDLELARETGRAKFYIQRIVKIEIAYEMAGERHTLPLTLESEFKSAILADSALEIYDGRKQTDEIVRTESQGLLRRCRHQQRSDAKGRIRRPRQPGSTWGNGS